MTTSTNTVARRAILYRDRAGEWRYKVQGWNWRTIDASEEGFKRVGTVRRRVETAWPGVEIVVNR